MQTSSKQAKRKLTPSGSEAVTLTMLAKTGLSSSIVTKASCTVGALGFLFTVITTVLVVRVKGRKLSYTAINNCCKR